MAATTTAGAAAEQTRRPGETATGYPSEHRYGPAQGVWQGMGRAICDTETKRGETRVSYSIYDLRPENPDPSWRRTVVVSG